MNYLKNHCWCNSSHWDNKSFDCQIVVSLSSYQDGYKEDWENLTHKVKAFNQEFFDEHIKNVECMMKRYPEEYDDKYLAKEKENKKVGYITISVFKPEVLKWLEENIPDIKGEKSWCVGSDFYNARGSMSGISVFMNRRKDAMLFIKTFSKWKKPIEYCQYFTDVRKTLDLKTLKYIKEEDD
jgi:hypothetical protein